MVLGMVEARSVNVKNTTTTALLYSILVVDLSPTFYCLPKPIFLYGPMVLLSTLIISTILLQCTTVVMLGYDWWLCMVINISVQYNGGFLPDIILLTQGYYHWGTRLITMLWLCIYSLVCNTR